MIDLIDEASIKQLLHTSFFDFIQNTRKILNIKDIEMSEQEVKDFLWKHEVFFVGILTDSFTFMTEPSQFSEKYATSSGYQTWGILKITRKEDFNFKASLVGIKRIENE